MENISNAEPRYYLTRDQLDSLEHFKEMFGFNAEQVTDLCSAERDDVVYGFELGKMHGWMRTHFAEMLDLCTDVRKQELFPDVEPGRFFRETSNKPDRA